MAIVQAEAMGGLAVKATANHMTEIAAIDVSVKRKGVAVHKTRATFEL